MCGIAGVLDYSKSWNVSETVARMTGAIAHRGPDGSGVVHQEHAGLGHRRLSIIDLEGGRQPMSTPDGHVHLTYNGEVYNYQELRRELTGLGYQFRTSSDTEVILYAYEAWGRRCVERFQGMFAFAIADYRRREILIARDHFGIKPLLYRLQPESFAFASEFSALQQLPDWTGEVDLLAIDLFLRYQYIPAPQTAFRQVFKLPAGHRMVIRMDERKQTLERYWTAEFHRKRRYRGQELVEALDATLKDSVRRHLVADVPFGALLSGGVDSSLVVSYMAELLGDSVRTFAIGFDDTDVSELQYARVVAQKYGTQHHEEVLQFNALDALPEIVRHHGEPFGDQSAIPTWAVSKLARSHVPMVLSGDGGDEFLAGYSSYAGWLNAVTQQTAPTAPSWKTPLRPLLKAVKPGHYRSASTAADDLQNWLPCIGRFTGHDRAQLWQRDLRFLSDQPGTTFQRALAAGVGLKGVNRVQRVDLETFLPEDILTKVDVASMRYGLEVRPPILDTTVFQLAASIPPEMLVDREGDRGGKLPLKMLAAKKFGQDFAFRRKQGFVMPLQKWLRKDPQSAARVRERLCDSGSELRRWFCNETVEAVLSHGRVENVWLLLVLQEWCRQMTTPVSVPAAP
jgi:asparagine synthase (glutamine-hydrolysing)